MWVISWMNRVNTTQPPLVDNFKAGPLIIATTTNVRSVQLYQRSCLVWRQIPRKKMTQVNPSSALLLLTMIFICALTFGVRPAESAAAVVTHQDHAAALTALLHRTVRSSDDNSSNSVNSVNEGGPCGANCIHRRLYSMCICVTCPKNSTICVMKSNTITINMTRP